MAKLLRLNIEQCRLLSDCWEVQADLNLHWMKRQICMATALYIIPGKGSALRCKNTSCTDYTHKYSVRFI